MKNTLLVRFIWFQILWLTMPAIVYSEQRKQPADQSIPVQKINLALRYAGDRLLDISGDTTSPIPPVVVQGANNFVIDLNHAILYDSLPTILEESFTRQLINMPYEVTLLGCNSDTILLGFSSIDVKQGAVPCMGREQEDSCYRLKVTFLPVSTAFNNRPLWIGMLALIAAGLILPVIYKQRKRLFGQLSAEEISQANLVTNCIQFGSASLDVGRQTLRLSGQAHKLTYRETKLLSVLASQPNQVLSRDHLMASVWEDEGIVVGRSLDVFISRLRKKLKDDPAVQISNAHGVGYKLEVSA